MALGDYAAYASKFKTPEEALPTNKKGFVKKPFREE